MKKKLLSIFLAIVLVFSCIPMSFAVTDSDISTEQKFNQDELEGTIDMKAGSKFYYKGANAFGPASCKEYFESEIKDENAVLKYEKMRLMKIVINIPKKNGLVVNKIIPEQEEAELPQTIKEKYQKYFGLQENESEYKYNFYFKENGEYSFKIKYIINNIQNEALVSYNVNDLVPIECINMRTALIKGCKDGNIGYEREYLTKKFLETVAKDYKNANGETTAQGIILGARDGDIENIIPLITSLDGVQYFKDNLLEIQLSNGYRNGFLSIDTIEPITRGNYGKLKSFLVTELGEITPWIPEDSYTPELIRDCVAKMPNLQQFSCSGSKFKDFTVFENFKNLNLVEAHLNGIESLEGIENNVMLGTLGVQKNSISDLTPLKECKDLEHFTGYNQSVEKKDPVLATKTENKIKIELPIPIDIDGNLTEIGKIVPPSTSVTEKNIVKATYNSKDINYTAFEENRKVYIELNKSDFDNKAEEILEDIKFEFNFHNCNGDDDRTRGKFNGVVNFKASFNPPTEEKATVIYEAKNTSKNRTDVDVDKNILKVEEINVLDYVNLPKNDNEYNVGETVTPQNPTTTKKINENGEETGVSTEIKPGESILVKYEVPNTNNVETYIKLTFEGYEPETLNVQVGENKFVGKFSFEDMELVHYDFISEDGKQIPKNIEEKIEDEFEKFKEYELYPDGEDVILKQPKNKTIKDTDGTWEFTGWAYKKEDGKYEYVKNNEKEVHHDEELKGVWKFVKDSSGGGTGGGGTPTPNPDKEDPDRVEGDDRIETSIEASEILYPNGTNAVVLANAERFSDVLTANPFAVQEKASALLTYKDKLPEKTLKEIERLGAKKIYVSGGYEAVSKKVVDSLAAKGYEIYRFDGLDRYDTARKIAIKIREKGNKEVVELASGENYPDALCMTSMAVKDNAPILLTRKDSIPKYTKQALAEWDIESVKIGGLDEAISKDVQNQIDKGFEITKGNKADSNVYDGAKKVSRFGGKDRYETSTIIAANSYQESKLGVYATGEDFPDALIAGNYAGRKEAPVLLVKRDTLPEVVEKYTTDSKIEKATVIGGVNAVSDKVFNLIKSAINK